MPRKTRNSTLETRASRSKLKASGKPYYVSIGEGLHLGYRKGERAGKWVARRYVGNQAYKVETIATADDMEDANNDTVLNFWQAQDRARSERGYVGPYRVKDAIAAYLNERGGGIETRIRCDKHILPSLGDKLVDDLTAPEIRQWHRNLAQSAPLNRTADFSDAEVVRRRKVSANRVLAILRAALNLAFRDEKVRSDTAWRRVEMFGNVDVARVTYLTIDEAQRLLNACDPDFRLIVRSALETGARYGELTRLRCRDFNPDSGTIHIRQAKSGIGRHIILTDTGAKFFAQLYAGRSGDAWMFGKEWGKGHQIARMRAACERAQIVPAVGFHQLRHTWASLAVMAGMPLPVVAKNMGHVDTRMVEKHYGHLAPSYVVDQVRKFAPQYGITEETNLVVHKGARTSLQ